MNHRPGEVDDMPALRVFLRPPSLEAAIKLLDRYGEAARPLAGGTTLALVRNPKQDILVDLSHAGLAGIEARDGARRIGAMTTVADVRRFLRGGTACALSDAVAGIGSRVLQNHVTVGGNCVMVYPWSDLPVVARAAGAQFDIEGTKESRRRFEAGTLYAAHPTRVLERTEVVRAVSFPTDGPGTASAFLKVTRNVGDHALASAAAYVTISDGVVREARVVVGGVKGLPQLVAEAGEAMAGRPIDGEAADEAGRIAADRVGVGEDIRASADFRRHLVAVAVADALRTAIARADKAVAP